MGEPEDEIGSDEVEVEVESEVEIGGCKVDKVVVVVVGNDSRRPRRRRVSWGTFCG